MSRDIFCRTVELGKKKGSCGKAISLERRTSGDIDVVSVPSTATTPDDGWSRPKRVATTEDLPLQMRAKSVYQVLPDIECNSPAGPSAYGNVTPGFDSERQISQDWRQRRS